MTTTSLADAKNRLSALIASAEATHERIIITKNGKPIVAMLSVDDLEELEESLYWASRGAEVAAAAAEPTEPLMSRDELLAEIRGRNERAIS